MHEHQIANLAARLYAAHDCKLSVSQANALAIEFHQDALVQVREWNAAHRLNPKPAGGGVITPSAAQAAGAV